MINDLKTSNARSRHRATDVVKLIVRVVIVVWAECHDRIIELFTVALDHWSWTSDSRRPGPVAT